jgi:glycosyltransferase involved in cell wall biosynthesis
MVSIIVPARNEEQDIAKCLESLLNQTYPNLEIIVVDDSSSDGTSEVVIAFEEKYPRIKLVSAGSKPEGWVGKSWPCWRGYEESKGDYLLFVDADSILDSSVVESSLAYVIEKKIEMFSLAPRVELHGIVARAVLPMIFGAINILYPIQKVNDKNSDHAYVFGTFILVRREVYASIGGHKKVSDEIVEDAAIARTAKTSGFNVRIERGLELVSTRWEKEPRSVYDGLERVTSTSVRSYGLVSILNAVLVFFVVLYPILFVIICVTLQLNSPLFLGLVGSLLNIATLLVLAGFEASTITGKFGISGFLYPLGCVLFISAIVSTSIKVSRSKAIKWKGQDYLQSLRK